MCAATAETGEAKTEETIGGFRRVFLTKEKAPWLAADRGKGESQNESYKNSDWFVQFGSEDFESLA